MDSAIVCFTDSYKQRLQGMKTESVPDILINLADACSRQGKYDVSAFWYRKALQIGDSLGISEGASSSCLLWAGSGVYGFTRF